MRIPRPKGSTEIGFILNKDPNNQQLQNQLVDKLLQHYINTGYTYCGQPMNIEQLSEYLQIDKSLITNSIINHGSNNFQLLDKDTQEEAHRALLGLVLGESLADRTRALEQYSILKSAQGHSYQPFISGEVNKALKLTQESTNALLQFYKAIAGNDGINIILNNNQNTQVNHNYLTVDKALTVINENTPEGPKALGNPESIQGLQAYLQDTPEVQANKQQGLDTSKEGLNFKLIAQVSEGLINDQEEEKGHINRRAQELDIDLEADEV